MSEINKISLSDYKSKLNFICRHMLETRPKKGIEYIPYFKPDFVKKNVRGNIRIELDKHYLNAEHGDYAFVYINLISQCDTEIMITVKGAECFFINGKKVVIDQEKAKSQHKEYALCRIDVNEGDNSIVFKCVKNDDGFYLDYIAAHIYWPYNWTCDYLIWVKDTVPAAKYYGEQGFALSRLMKSNEAKEYDECETVFPDSMPCDDIISFGKLYPDTRGSYAAAYSVAKADGTLDIASGCETYIYINGVLSHKYDVQKGDSIFVVCKKGEEWGFESRSNELLHLPFIKTKRDVHWIIIGAFDNGKCPEFQLKAPYKNADGEETFWRFADENVYLRAYLDTSFFGQWFYGLMVGEYGILKTSEYYPEYYDYFYDSMRIIADFHDLMQLDARLFGDPAFLKRSIRLSDLDSIGTIGMNLCELYLRENDAEVKNRIFSILFRLSDAVYNNIPRMEDGTFYRVETMWADDTFMSCPFLVRMGNITGDAKYYDEVVKQLKLYTEKLFMPDENIFSHIYFPKLKRANRVPWGRGNGWVYLSFADVIEHLPEAYPGKDDLIGLFKKAVSGLCGLQSEKGLWHQVLDMPGSYLETSCTAIFSLAILKGIKTGILEKEKYLPAAEAAVNGILNHSIEENGDVTGVCRGSGCQDDPEYYANLETIRNDDHGTGVVLAAVCALLDCKEEE